MYIPLVDSSVSFKGWISCIVVYLSNGIRWWWIIGLVRGHVRPYFCSFVRQKSSEQLGTAHPKSRTTATKFFFEPVDATTATHEFVILLFIYIKICNSKIRLEVFSDFLPDDATESQSSTTEMYQYFFCAHLTVLIDTDESDEVNCFTCWLVYKGVLCDIDNSLTLK